MRRIGQVQRQEALLGEDQEGPPQSDQVVAGRQDGTLRKVFPMNPQALTGEQAQLEGAVLDSARPLTTGRGKGPVTGEGLGIGLPLLIQTAPKGEEGGIGTLRSICQIWSSILEGSHGGISMPSFVAIGR